MSTPTTAAATSSSVVHRVADPPSLNQPPQPGESPVDASLLQRANGGSRLSDVPEEGAQAQSSSSVVDNSTSSSSSSTTTTGPTISEHYNSVFIGVTGTAKSSAARNITGDGEGGCDGYFQGTVKMQVLDKDYNVEVKSSGKIVIVNILDTVGLCDANDQKTENSLVTNLMNDILHDGMMPLRKIHCIFLFIKHGRKAEGHERQTLYCIEQFKKLGFTNDRFKIILTFNDSLSKRRAARMKKQLLDTPICKELGIKNENEILDGVTQDYVELEQEKKDAEEDLRSTDPVVCAEAERDLKELATRRARAKKTTQDMLEVMISKKDAVTIVDPASQGRKIQERRWKSIQYNWLQPLRKNLGVDHYRMPSWQICLILLLLLLLVVPHIHALIRSLSDYQIVRGGGGGGFPGPMKAGVMERAMDWVAEWNPWGVSHAATQGPAAGLGPKVG